MNSNVRSLTVRRLPERFRVSTGTLSEEEGGALLEEEGAPLKVGRVFESGDVLVSALLAGGLCRTSAALASPGLFPSSRSSAIMLLGTFSFGGVSLVAM